MKKVSIALIALFALTVTPCRYIGINPKVLSRPKAASMIKQALVINSPEFKALPAVRAVTQQESKMIRVRFAKGATSRTYKDSVSHSTNTYTVRARKGQTMTVVVTSPNNEAVFSITQQLEANTDPIEIATDQKRWTGRLFTTGDYYIGVGAERDVATYTITITVK